MQALNAWIETDGTLKLTKSLFMNANANRKWFPFFMLCCLMILYAPCRHKWKDMWTKMCDRKHLLKGNGMNRNIIYININLFIVFRAIHYFHFEWNVVVECVVAIYWAIYSGITFKCFPIRPQSGTFIDTSSCIVCPSEYLSICTRVIVASGQASEKGKEFHHPHLNSDITKSNDLWLWEILLHYE